jgi:hypothetical protein
VDLNEEVAAMTLCRMLQIARAIRERTERPLDVPAGPAGVIVVGGTIAAHPVAAVIELPAGHPAPDFGDMTLKGYLRDHRSFHEVLLENYWI